MRAQYIAFEFNTLIHFDDYKPVVHRHSIDLSVEIDSRLLFYIYTSHIFNVQNNGYYDTICECISTVDSTVIYLGTWACRCSMALMIIVNHKLCCIHCTYCFQDLLEWLIEWIPVFIFNLSKIIKENCKLSKFWSGSILYQLHKSMYDPKLLYRNYLLALSLAITMKKNEKSKYLTCTKNQN